MLITKEVEVSWHHVSRKHYEDLGYIYTKNGDKFIVLIEHLYPNSFIRIKVKCDYCGEEFTRRFSDHTTIINKQSINKDCCKKCSPKKYADSMQILHGVNNTFQLDSTKEKIKQTNLEKYGVENAAQNPEIYQKSIDTSIKRYGVDNPSKSEEVKQKIIDTIQSRYGVDNIMELEEYRLKIAETLSENGSVSTSKQQIYIHEVIGGEINYSDNTPIIDIAFPKEKIAIEYDGGGHDLKVTLGKMSLKEFSNKERKREIYLRERGWKLIRIISKSDYIPTDSKILEMVCFSRQYISTGHSWISFDIDNKKVVCSQFENSYEFGKLRKIK